MTGYLLERPEHEVEARLDLISDLLLRIPRRALSRRCVQIGRGKSGSSTGRCTSPIWSSKAPVWTFPHRETQYSQKSRVEQVKSKSTVEGHVCSGENRDS